MSKSITIKNIDNATLTHLRNEAKRHRMNLNTYLRFLIRKSLETEIGEQNKTKDKNISDLSGTWTEKDYREFIEETGEFRKVDENQWK
ncbi:MAG: hypothetical protein ABEH43_04030 [Flavobacteriales bacterium]